jgi:hypothetical protein
MRGALPPFPHTRPWRDACLITDVPVIIIFVNLFAFYNERERER